MRPSQTPALAGSLLLHAAVILLAFVSWQSASRVAVGSAVPVTIVSTLPYTAPTIAAEPQPDQAAEPAPVIDTSTPAAAPPPPAPPTPKPEPTPQKPDAKSIQAKLQKTSPPSRSNGDAGGLDLGQIASQYGGSAPKPTKSGAKPHPSAPPGPATPPVGSDDVAGLVAKVERLWYLNCDLPATRNVVADVRFTISSDGHVVSGPDLVNQNGANAEAFADARSAAVRAVKAGQPYSATDVRPAARDQPITLRFRGKTACEGR